MMKVKFLKFIYNKFDFFFKYKQLAENFTWLFIDKLFRIFISVVVGAWVARYLGPTEYGIYAYASAAIALVASFATLGLQQIVVREMVKNPSKEYKIIITSFVLQLISSSIVCFATIIFFNNFINETQTVKIIVSIFAFSVIFKSSDTVRYWFEAKVQSKYIVWCENIVFVIISLIKIILILLNYDLIYFALVFLFESILIFFALIFLFLYKNNAKNYVFPSITQSIELIKFSWPEIFAGLVLMVQARIDQVMIANLMTSKDVGYYSVSLMIIEGLCFLPMILLSTLTPKIIDSRKISKQLYKENLINFYRMNVFIFIITFLPIIFFAKTIVNLLFGDQYFNSILILQVMSFRIFFACLGVSRSIYILSENLLKFSLITMTIGAAVNILLNYIWIPLYGSIGAIYASYISLFITIFAIDLFYSKTRNNTKLLIISIFTFYKMFYFSSKNAK